MLVANPADRLVYYYMEGMAAPMGNFRAAGRSPKAALVLDRSLRETRAGRLLHPHEGPRRGPVRRGLLPQRPARRALLRPHRAARSGSEAEAGGTAPSPIEPLLEQKADRAPARSWRCSSG